MIKLFQFPISHFCEKARWALDYKSIDYDQVNLLPGLHINQMHKIGAKSSVPAILDIEKLVQGSSKIIDYLDEQFPNQPLTPKNKELREKALELEAYLDAEVGINVRLCLYHILLDYPKTVIPFFTHQGPWYGSLYLMFAYPKLQKAMRMRMNINDQTFSESKEKLKIAIFKLKEMYRKNRYLVGDEFTRADLTAASLLAPMTLQKEYGLDWPDELPIELENFLDEFRDQLSWVKILYRDHR